METVFTAIVLYTCMFWRVGGVQLFLVTPQDTAVIKGQTAVMKCSVENRVGAIQWAKGGLMLGYNRTIPGFRRYSVISDNDQEFNLQIINVNLDDDAEFECQVGRAPSNPELQASGHLRVLVPPNMPEIVGHPNGSVVEVPYSQSLLNLTCVATNGKPAAKIKWFRNGQEVRENIWNTTEAIPADKRKNTRSVLTISPQYREDNGAEYTCQARNDALITGPLETMVKLSVQYPPEAPEITGYQRNQTVRTNGTLLMTCTSKGGNPLAQVVWFKNDKKIDFSYTQRGNSAVNTLTFTVQPSDNDAEIRCEAWNVVNANNHLVARRTLIVYFPPKNVTITGERLAKAGETISLSCQSSNSNPAAVITWFARGVQLQQDRTRVEESPDGGYITISDIDVRLTDRQNTVMYTCQATNQELGLLATSTATLSVLYPPDPPMIYYYNNGEAIRAGQGLEMECRAARGNPIATLQWYKGTDPIQSESSQVGNIASAKVNILAKADDNNAIYKCTATNDATDVPLEVVRVLTVHFPPSSVTVSSSPAVARAGQRLTLTCVSASSNPAAIITWIRDNRGVNGQDLGKTAAENGGKSTKNILVIENPRAKDHEAVISCRATNFQLKETVNDAITLNVLFQPVFDALLLKKLMNITEGESRVVDLTARANPSNATYNLYRNGVPLSLPGDISAFTLTAGVLTISGISRSDGGQFSIHAANTEGASSFNFSINVQYPAEIEYPTAVEGEVGTSATLKCTATGNPMTPHMITWSRSDFDMTRARQVYTDGVGTLVINDLTKQDSGTFVCSADNGIGDGPAATKEVTLTVLFKPLIDKSQKYSKAASKAGRTGKLICRAEGAPTVTFQWAKDGKRLQTDGVKYEIEQKVADDGVFESILLVRDVTKHDYGVYQCIVTNDKGDDTFPILFDDTTKPDYPYDIEFVNRTHNSLTIQWTPGFNGGLKQSYRVRYRPVGSKAGYTQVDVLPLEATSFTLKGLALGTTYELTVMAYNDIGGSSYQPTSIEASTSNLKPVERDAGKGTETDTTEDTPVIIILVVCVVGIFLLALNIGLILFFVRKRRKRLENGSDTTSHTNTIELYGPSKETALYPMTPSDENRSYGTYDKNLDDDFSSYEHVPSHVCGHESQERICVDRADGKSGSVSWRDNCCFTARDEDVKRVFLPPPEYGSVTYSHNNLDSPTFEHRRPIQTEMKQPYNDDDSARKSPWRYEDQYRSKGKGSFEGNHADHMREASTSGNLYEPNGRVLMRDMASRPKSVTELSERSSRSGHKTPPPPPVRSSSKGAADVPPIPARNYGPQEPQPRYVPPPGSLSSFSNNVNVVPNPAYDGPSVRTPSPRTDPTDDMRGHLV